MAGRPQLDFTIMYTKQHTTKTRSKHVQKPQHYYCPICRLLAWPRCWARDRNLCEYKFTAPRLRHGGTVICDRRENKPPCTLACTPPSLRHSSATCSCAQYIIHIALSVSVCELRMYVRTANLHARVRVRMICVHQKNSRALFDRGRASSSSTTTRRDCDVW